MPRRLYVARKTGRSHYGWLLTIQSHTPHETMFRSAVRSLDDTDLTLQIGTLRKASRDGRILQSMERLYSDLNAEIVSQPGHCWFTTACCKFERADGHLLYVTAIEVCYYLSRYAPGNSDGPFCTHLVEGRCSIRDVRPLGCRIFYCDPDAAQWQQPMAEIYLARLRRLQEHYELPNFYEEWLHVLQAIRSQRSDRRDE